MMVNFDNAATTFPKPRTVRQAMEQALLEYGGNAGRGGHILTTKTSEQVFAAREEAADFFGGKPENTIFCWNCTHALNLAIQGILQKGDHVVISSLEHNAVVRPVAMMIRERGIRCSIAPVFADDAKTVAAFRERIRPDTKAVICTLASNVTGQILPFREIGALCQERGICMIADGAQACGTLPVQLSDGINILCTAGHKGLYGASGTGLLLTDSRYPIRPLLYGGTGSLSAHLEMPDFLPDRLECGTLNIAGILSLRAGIAFVKEKTIQGIFQHETACCNRLLTMLHTMPQITIYRQPEASYVPIVSFNAKAIPSETLADSLSRMGFCLRAGLHCAPLAHRSLGTITHGTVRFAPSIFNTISEVTALGSAIRKQVKVL
jgi:cysteine desulfurase family protein